MPLFMIKDRKINLNDKFYSPSLSKYSKAKSLS